MYGKNGKVFERKFFNGDVPATVVESFASGFHSIKTTWDDKGHESTLEYFDVAGRPVNAKFYFGDNQELSYHKIEFIYQGNTIVEERLYEVNSTVPGKIIDTLKNDYIGSGGLSLAHKNRQ